MKKPDENSVFKWKDFAQWRPVLEGMFGGILATPEVQARAGQADTEYGLSSVDFEKITGHSVDSLLNSDAVTEFRRLYPFIRVYHACRPTDVQIYYKKGLLPSIDVKDIQINRFREIFLSGRFPKLTEEMFQQSIEKRGSADEDLCLGIDDNWIIEFTGHYLIYGSEYLSTLVSQLPVKDVEPYLSELRKAGKPTFIEINLPNTIDYDVKDGDILELLYDMITTWIDNVAHSRAESGPLDCTFSIKRPIPPEHICGDYNPPRIPDSINGRRIYITETGEYEG